MIDLKIEEIQNYDNEQLRLINYLIKRIEDNSYSSQIDLNSSHLDASYEVDFTFSFIEDDLFKFTLILSIKQDLIRVNSTFFDVTKYYDNTSINEVEIFLDAILFGKYKIELVLDKNDEINSREIRFLDERLSNYNHTTSSFWSFLYKDKNRKKFPYKYFSVLN